MKLATLKNSTRDGQLVVVSRDLSRAVAVPQTCRDAAGALDELVERGRPKLAEVWPRRWRKVT